MLAIIDGDIVAYRCSASAENDPEDIALARMEAMMRDILHESESDRYVCYLTGKDNFRYDLYADYKANRKDKPKPQHLAACRDYLSKYWEAVISAGCEADDLMGITATAHDNLTSHVICSIDKDLLQIPGGNWNFVTKERTFVSPLDGLRSFYRQLILGDISDNIPGFDGKARQKWPKFMECHRDFIDNSHDEFEMFNYVKDIYTSEQDIVTMGRLLFIQAQNQYSGHRHVHTQPPPQLPHCLGWPYGTCSR